MLFYIFWVPGLVIACAICYIFLRTLAQRRDPRTWGPTERASAVALATWVGSGLIVIALPVLGVDSWGGLGTPFLLLSSAGAFMAARYIRSAWCLIVPGGVLFGALWVFGLAALWAYKSGWQGLDIQEVSGIDQGEGFGIGLFLIFGTVAAPFWGFFLGLLAHLRLGRAAAPAA